jgi:hypothetical protein
MERGFLNKAYSRRKEGDSRKEVNKGASDQSKPRNIIKDTYSKKPEKAEAKSSEVKQSERSSSSRVSEKKEAFYQLDRELSVQRDKKQKTIEEFNRTFDTTIREDKKGVFDVYSTDRVGGGKYSNIIHMKEGYISEYSNYKHNTQDWHLSDVVNTQLQLALQKAGKDSPPFDLKGCYVRRINNEGTLAVAERYVSKYGSDQKTFEKGSEEFNALMGTTLAKSNIHLLKDHFPRKEITRIAVMRDYREEINIDYQIGDKIEK